MTARIILNSVAVTQLTRDVSGLAPFATSDNSMAFRTGDNRQWLRAGILAAGTDLVYPKATSADRLWSGSAVNIKRIGHPTIDRQAGAAASSRPLS